MKPFDLSQRIYRNEVNVMDWPYNAKGDGVTDDTAAIQAAFNSGATRVFFPARMPVASYRVSATLLIPAQLEIVGENRWLCRIESTNIATPILRSVSGNGDIHISDLYLGFVGVPANGATAIQFDNNTRNSIRDVVLNNVWCGIKLTGGGNYICCDIRGIQIYGYTGYGVWLADVLAVHLDGFEMNAANATGIGILLTGGTEGCIISNGEVLLGLHSIATQGNAGSEARFQSPWYNKFFGVYCDSASAQCVYLRQAQYTTFNDCWIASAGRSPSDVNYVNLANFAGIDIDRCFWIKFLGGEFFGNGGYGAVVYAGIHHIMFRDVTVQKNGRGNPTGGDTGIYFTGNLNDFSVLGCVFVKDPDTVSFKQIHAVAQGGTGSDRYHIADNLLGGCDVLDSGTTANKRVANNY